MTESDPMLQEMIRAHKDLSIIAAKTRNKFDERMRATVKELLSYHYIIERTRRQSAPKATSRKPSKMQISSLTFSQEWIQAAVGNS